MSNESSYRETEMRIADALREILDEHSRHGDRTTSLSPYIRRHLIEHAERGDILTSEIINPRILPFLDAQKARPALLRRLLSLQSDIENQRLRTLVEAWVKLSHAWEWDSPAANWDALCLYLLVDGHRLEDRGFEGASWQTLWAEFSAPAPEIIATDAGWRPVIARGSSPNDPPTVLSGRRGGGISIHSIESASQLATLPGSGKATAIVTWDGADGKVFAVIAGVNDMAYVWDVAARRPVSPPLAHISSAEQLALASLKDGREVLVSGQSGSWSVTDLTTGKSMWSVETSLRELGWATNSIESMAVATLRSGGSYVIVGGRQDKLLVYDIESGQLVHELHFEVPEERTRLVAGGAAFHITSIASSRVGNAGVVLAGDLNYGLRAWDTENLSPLPCDDQRGVVGIEFTLAHDRPAAAVWDWRGIRILSLPALAIVSISDNDDDLESVVPFSRASSLPLLVGAHRDGTLRVTDLERKHERPRDHNLVRNVSAIAIAPRLVRRRQIICASDSSGNLKAWQLSDGTPTNFTPKISYRLVSGMCIAESDVGKSLVIAGGGDDFSRSHYVSVIDLESGKQIGRRLPHAKWVIQVGLSRLADGRQVILTSARDCSLNVWDLETRRRVGRRFTADHWLDGLLPFDDLNAEPACICYSNGRETKLHTVDLASGLSIRPTFVRQRGWMDCGDIFRANDGVPLIVRGDDSGGLSLWNATTQADIGRPIHAHDGRVTAVRALRLSDGRPIAATAGWDAKVRLWDLHDMAAVTHSLMVPDRVTTLDLLEEDGTLFVAAGGRKGVLLLSLDIDRL